MRAAWRMIAQRRAAGRWSGALVLVALVCAVPAHASVCCMTAGLFGVGRLALWEQAAVGVRATGAETFGAWSAEGAWTPSPAGWVDRELRLDGYALLRLSERGQIHVLLPTVGNVRGADPDVAAGGGLGDVELGVRYELVNVGERAFVPAIGVTASALLPSSVRPEEATGRLDVDATGRGAPGVAGAVSFEQALGTLFGRVDLGGTLYAPFVRVDLRQHQRYGPTLAAVASGGGTVAGGLLLGLTAGVAHDLPVVIAKEEQPGSSATSATAGVLASWTVDPHWTLLASASSGLFVDALGQNRPGRVTASLGVRYGAW
ncbi:MAG: hypothetical protein IT383_04360 [Deltaproteobacteria bacterium]|nr:hypothetical protein [Deltaproteobacteria bacterium]